MSLIVEGFGCRPIATMRLAPVAGVRKPSMNEIVLRRSRLCIAAKIELVTDIGGLKKYLAKERTPQAGYKRRDLGGRISGSHRLPGGGDRVRLSRQLERDAIEAGLVDPWKHTNAKRSAQRKDYRPRLSSRNVEGQETQW
jgi:hypothetical protein